MGKPRFDRSKRYINRKGVKFGKGVWYDENGTMLKPGWGVPNSKKGTVTQYNTDGTITTFTQKQWHDKKTKEHEYSILRNDRKYAIPFIPSKKMTITIDEKSPTRNNAGVVISENLLDSIASNASKARLPFSTALGIAAQESTLGYNPKRTVGKSMLPWLYVLNNSKGQLKNAAASIPYDNVQSPSLLISNWKRINENPFAAYHYDTMGRLRKENMNVDYYNKDFSSSLKKDNRYIMKDTSPLFHGFRSYKKDPYNYNPGDPGYPDKVEKQKNELVNHSPEIKAYMKKHNLKSDGGYLNNDWDSLSYRDKAEMMKVAIANGITSLPEIRKSYNEFAKGGKMKWTMQDEAGYRYWRSKLPKNLRETNDNDYDMRAAYKAGMQPQWNDDDKSYHLGSRDPQSGRILKSPHHPTFLKALTTDAAMGYYPIMDSNGNIYTETWRGNVQYPREIEIPFKAYGGNLCGGGGYKPSGRLQKDIAAWEGSEMKKNAPFSEMTRQFNEVIPPELQARLSTTQLDALYSYGYNVGMGNLKKRVLPTLTAYAQGMATNEDVQKSMWASKDSQLRGLARRRSWERDMFNNNYRAPFSNETSHTKGVGSHIQASNLGLQDGFFDNMNSQIANIQIPQMQVPSNLDTDPSTLYKAPVIDAVDIPSPKVDMQENVYDPRQERLEKLQDINTIFGMFGGQTPFSFLGTGNGSPGLMNYVNAVYGM